MTGCGIHNWGYAIPRRRLSNAETQTAWKRPPMPGMRSIAGQDEDSITLGVQAALDALSENTLSIDGLIFATTTAPFAEKSSAAVLADILGLPPGIRTFDVNSSLRAGTIALGLARDLKSSAACSNVLLVAADMRLAKPGAMDEAMFAHAGVALVIGSGDDCVAEILASSSYSTSRFDAWRLPNERYPRSADQRFAREGAYAEPTRHVMKNTLDSMGWQPSDVGKVIPYSPDVKSASKVLQQFGFDSKAHYCDLVSSRIGLTGTAHTLLMLCSAIEKSASGERLIVLGYGDGADGHAFQIRREAASGRFSAVLRSSYEISYNTYLRLHGLHVGSEESCAGFTSEIMSDRNSELWLNLTAHRCSECATVTTLPLPSCPNCGASDSSEPYGLQRTGDVFAITHEYYYPTPEPPLGMATVDLDGGGRLTVQVADEDVPLKIGDRVELVLRRMHDAGGFPNYFWKCRAVG